MRKLALFIVLAVIFQSTASSQSCLPDGITFSSQSEIDNFQTNNPNCTEIEGDVEINGYMSGTITNLNGLSVLTSIGGNLIINGNPSLTSLTGLDNVTYIGGDLAIGRYDGWVSGNPSLTSLTGLDNVTSIGGGLWITNNDALTSLTGLDNLTSIGGDLWITNNASLSSCEAQGLCDYLSNPNGSVNIFNNATGCNNPPEIASACGITLPCLPFGNYYFFTQSQIDNLSTNYPNCTEMEGNILINGDSITNLNGLNVVTYIGGDLVIGRSNGPFAGNPSLTSLTGLDNVTSIGGYLWINNNDALTDLIGLEGLTSIGGDLSIGLNAYLTSITGLDNVTSIGGDLSIGSNALTSLTGLDNLASIGGHLSIGSNYALTSLTGLDNVTSIGGYVWINGNNALTDLIGLEGLTSVVGNLSIYNNWQLTSLTGLDNVTSIGGTLSIGGSNTYLTSLTGLDNVTSIGGDVYISGGYSLTSLSGLDNVTSIGGDVDISYASALTSLTGLYNVTSIGGSLQIFQNNALTSLSGLDNIEANSIEDLTIKDNLYLSHCTALSICNYLGNPNGSIEIDNNTTGCDSQDEVYLACETVSVDEVYVSDKLFIFPNPSSTQITIELPNVPQKNAVLSIYNMNTQQMLTSKITEQKTVVDISGLPNGFYFVKVIDDKRMMVSKMVKN